MRQLELTSCSSLPSSDPAMCLQTLARCFLEDVAAAELLDAVWTSPRQSVMILAWPGEMRSTVLKAHASAADELSHQWGRDPPTPRA